MALRFDSLRLDARNVRKDARGFVRVPAIIAKPGVYTYTEPGGRSVREYLPPEEVARADSLASVSDAPVTIRHPAKMVDPATWGSVSIGHASGPAKATPEGALAELVISRADAQAQIGNELVEVSRGVQVRIDETPGVTPAGEPYDRIQRDIVYNHIALGPRNWGRQGAGVSLRLDSAGDEISEPPMIKIKDKSGKVLEFKTDSEAQAYFDGLQARADMAPPFAKKGEKEEEDEEKEKAKKEAKDAKDRADSLQAKLDAHEARERAAARAALEQSARAVLGAEAKFDAAGADGKPVPMTDRAVRELVIKRLDAKADLENRADSYVEAYYDVVITSAKPSANPGHALAAQLGGVRVDGTGTLPAEPAPNPELKMRKDAQDAWKSNKGAALSR